MGSLEELGYIKDKKVQRSYKKIKMQIKCKLLKEMHYFEIDVDDDNSVANFREEMEERLFLSPEAQVLKYKGKKIPQDLASWKELDPPVAEGSLFLIMQ